jgi:hypothetical protein
MCCCNVQLSCAEVVSTSISSATSALSEHVLGVCLLLTWAAPVISASCMIMEAMPHKNYQQCLLPSSAVPSTEAGCGHSRSFRH